MPLDRVGSIQEEAGTDGEGTLGPDPAGLCVHSQGCLILIHEELDTESALLLMLLYLEMPEFER